MFFLLFNLLSDLLFVVALMTEFNADHINYHTLSDLYLYLYLYLNLYWILEYLMQVWHLGPHSALIQLSLIYKCMHYFFVILLQIVVA